MKKTIILLFFLCVVSIAFSQSRISYSAENKNIANILHEIEMISNYHFSYNSSIFEHQDNKSISFQNKTIEECLQLIIGTEYTYNILGNQVIIRKKENTSKNKKEHIEPKERQNQKIITIYDTIPYYDTITTKLTILDTIHITDSILHIDTITLQRYETNYLHTNNKCLSFSLNAGLEANIIHFYNNNEINDLYEPSLGFYSEAEMTYKRNHILFTTGLSYQNIRIHNSYTVTSYSDDGIATYTDTIWYWALFDKFTYYKFNNSGDSVAVHVLDSTYTYKLFENPKKIEINRELNSALSWQYISIPLGLGMHFNLSNTFAIQPHLFLNTMFRIKAKGKIPDESFSYTYEAKDILKPITFSATISCNLLYSIEKHISIQIKPFYTIQPSIFLLNDDAFEEQGMISNFGLIWGFCYTIPR